MFIAPFWLILKVFILFVIGTACRSQSRTSVKEFVGSGGKILVAFSVLSSCLGEKLHWCASWLWCQYSGFAGQAQCWKWEEGTQMISVAGFCLAVGHLGPFCKPSQVRNGFWKPFGLSRRSQWMQRFKMREHHSVIMLDYTLNNRWFPLTLFQRRFCKALGRYMIQTVSGSVLQTKW